MDQTLEHAADERGVAAAQFAPGATIGHFRIVRELGAGGMGVVFEAYDPDLDRHVAIKVVRDREAGSAAGVRLVREAQAMAKLAHPNVVPVHEVGTIEGQVFVVMELVRGGTLATWLDARHGWRDVVRAFVQAGEGLAAAHRAGLVHRDFKPTNVLVDNHGHARVSDFGLAREDTEPPQRRFADGSEPTRPAGTPAYMAPEQRAGEPVDARADQYSFALSLERALEVAKDRPPRGVRAAIARALANDPAERFPSIGELLDVLRRALDARRRVVVAVTTGIAVAAATTAIAAWMMRPAPDDCEDGARMVDALWNPAVRDAQAASFTKVRPAAAQSIALAGKMLDGWAGSWRLGRQAACRAEPAVRPARLACLDTGLGELRAQLAAWQNPEPRTVDRAVSAAGALHDPAECAHRTGGGTVTPAARAILDRAAAIRASDRTGHADAMKDLVQPLLADATKLGDPEAKAAALLAAGTVQYATTDLETARKTLAEAAIEAGRAGDDTLLIDALRMGAIVVTDLGRPNDSFGLLDAAEAVSARSGIDREYQLASVRGNSLLEAGRTQEAEKVLLHAVELIEPKAARDTVSEVELSRAVALVGTCYNQEYQFDKAIPMFKRALAIAERDLGPTHPSVGKTLADLAEAESFGGRLDDANADVARAKDIFVAAYGPDHPLVGQTLASWASIAAHRGKPDEAIALFEQARAALTGKLPPDHDVFVAIESQLAEVYDTLKNDCKSAIPHYEAAAAMIDRRSPNSTVHAGQLVSLAQCLESVDRGAEAYADATKALGELEHDHAPAPKLAEALVVLADMEETRGHRGKAIEDATRLLAVTHDSDSPLIAQMRAHATAQLAKWKK